MDTSEGLSVEQTEELQRMMAIRQATMHFARMRVERADLQYKVNCGDLEALLRAGQLRDQMKKLFNFEDNELIAQAILEMNLRFMDVEAQIGMIMLTLQASGVLRIPDEESMDAGANS